VICKRSYFNRVICPTFPINLHSYIYHSYPQTIYSTASNIPPIREKVSPNRHQGQKIREIYLPVSAEKPTLGISLQWTPLSVTEDVWHILDVIPNSPADAAGLLPYGDYVIGSPEGLVRGESGLSELVEDVCFQFPPLLHGRKD
jgi:hypothetical protein